MRIGNDNCPSCKTLLDAVEGINDKEAMPNPHDITICVKCGEILEFSYDMALVIASDKVFNELDESDRLKLLAYQKYIREK